MKSNPFWTTEHNETGLRRKPHVQHVSLRFVIWSRKELGNNPFRFFKFRSGYRCPGAAVPEHCSAFSIWKPVCSFVGNRKSFFLDAFPGFSERRPQRRHASSIRLQLDEDTIRIFNQFLFCWDFSLLHSFFFYTLFEFESYGLVDFTASPGNFIISELPVSSVNRWEEIRFYSLFVSFILLRCATVKWSNSLSFVRKR